MGWKQFFRGLEADRRRSARERARTEREALRSQIRQDRAQARLDKEYEKQAEKQRAKDEVEEYDEYLEVLVSLHKECSEPWAWPAWAASAAPAPPIETRAREAEAQRALDAYSAGFLSKVFGGAKKERAALEQQLEAAKADDRLEHQKNWFAHQQEHESWSKKRRIAAGVMARDLGAYRAALDLARPFEALRAFKSRVVVADLQSDVATIRCHIDDEEIVPREEMKLTASGKVSTKEMAAGKYWLLYQDHVCSAALRIARETFAVLPIQRVIVNIGASQLDTATGHPRDVVFLAANIEREAFGLINFAAIDPSDSFKNFGHRMKFKKTSGFDAVDPITHDEQWVSSK